MYLKNLLLAFVMPAMAAALIGCGSNNAGVVVATTNPLVAAYYLTLSKPGDVSVEFGTDSSYGKSTSMQTLTTSGVATTLVAGMQQNTLYHMRALVTYTDGSKFTDEDHAFQTGTLPTGVIPSYTVQTTSGATPQPGIELVDLIQEGTGVPSTAFATDLDGKVIWAYLFPDRQPGSILYPVKLLKNGHYGALIAPLSNLVATSPTTPVPAGTLNVLREFDLAGDTVQQLTMAELNTRMATAGFKVNLQLFSHDFEQLPNGHWLVIANTVKTFTNLPGYPGSEDVTGDVVIDLDTDLNPVWYWNEFDHLDVNRHPYSFPDWTHSNSIAYSPDDGNFIISVRHQNWVIKVDYRDGAGTGNILWKLGEGGDFKLVNGADPADWFYAQHDAQFASANTTGVFTMSVMDNGNDRTFPAGVLCNTAGSPPCLYTTIPLIQVNEKEKTATLLFNLGLATNYFSAFAGDTRVQPNGNIEYNLAGVAQDAYVFEITPQQANPLTVWQMHLTANNTYRAFRTPSLYNGVQW